jgi:hypothetical protein
VQLLVHDAATQVVLTHDPLLQILPEVTQSVQAPPPLPQAALAFAEAQPASVQHVLQLLGLQGAAPVSA